jgi:hypothetical protein
LETEWVPALEQVLELALAQVLEQVLGLALGQVLAPVLALEGEALALGVRVGVLPVG